MKLPNLAKATSLGAAVLVLSAGAAFAVVATSSVNVRSGPSTSFRAVDMLRAGEQVAVVDRDGSWCAVQKSGPDGWVACRYLSDRIRYRDRDFDDGPSVSLSFGYGIRPDRPRRPPPPWWYDDDDRWDRPSRPGASFGFSIVN